MNSVVIDYVNKKISILTKNKIENTIEAHVFKADSCGISFDYIGLDYIDISQNLLKLDDVQEKMRKYISYDTLFESENFKKLEIKHQLDLLYLLKTYKAKYSDSVYYDALWYPQEIINFVKESLPRYSDNGYYQLEDL